MGEEVLEVVKIGLSNQLQANVRLQHINNGAKASFENYASDKENIHSNICVDNFFDIVCLVRVG